MHNSLLIVQVCQALLGALQPLQVRFPHTYHENETCRGMHVYRGQRKNHSQVPIALYATVPRVQ